MDCLLYPYYFTGEGEMTLWRLLYLVFPIYREYPGCKVRCHSPSGVVVTWPQKLVTTG